MNKKLPILLVAGVLFGSAFAAHGADNVIANPTLHNGNNPQAINPSDRIMLSPPNQPTRDQLYAKPGFGVIQDFTGFVKRDTLNGGSNIMTFSDPNRADLQVRFADVTTGTLSDSGRGNLTGDWTTSPNNAFLLGSDNAKEDAHTISAFLDFGRYSGNEFTVGNGPDVSAVSFMMTSSVSRYKGVSSIDVTYFSSTGAELITQTLNSEDFLTNAYVSLFFAYNADEGVSIGSVKIAVSVNAKQGTERPAQVLFGIDDIGYTSAIPEASHVTMAFVGISLLAAFALRRRARSGK